MSLMFCCKISVLAILLIICYFRSIRPSSMALYKLYGAVTSGCSALFLSVDRPEKLSIGRL